jgi:hypothetical protein
VAVLVRRQRQHERSYCLRGEESDDDELASGARATRSEQYWATRGEGVNTVSRRHFDADVSVRFEKDDGFEAAAGAEEGAGASERETEAQLFNAKVLPRSLEKDFRKEGEAVVCCGTNSLSPH